MNAEAKTDYADHRQEVKESGEPSALDAKRAALTEQLRSARSALSPKAAVAAAMQSGDVSEAADLAASLAAQLPAVKAGFQPRSITMKLILERPDVTLRLALAIATLLFGARLATQFGSAAAMIRTLKQTLDSVKGS